MRSEHYDCVLVIYYTMSYRLYLEHNLISWMGRCARHSYRKSECRRHEKRHEVSRAILETLRALCTVGFWLERRTA